MPDDYEIAVDFMDMTNDRHLWARAGDARPDLELFVGRHVVVGDEDADLKVARVIAECRPEWVFLENVAGHVTLGLESVLGELWRVGYTPAAGLFSAAEVGAPHQRQRIFILAHTDEPASRHGQLQPSWEQRLHPLAAAPAWRTLAAAHGLAPVDLAADGPGPASDPADPV